MQITVNTNPYYNQANAFNSNNRNDIALPLQEPENKKPNIDTFELAESTSAKNGKYKDSFLYNVADIEDDGISKDVLRVNYYGLMLNGDNETANRVFTWSGPSGTSMQYKGNGGTLELLLGRYVEVRDEIIRAFGDDSELLSKNLDSLDKAFEVGMKSLARETARIMECESDRTQYYARPGIEYEPHKLATNKDFNVKEFESNSKNLMKELGQAFLQKIKDGLNYADAKKSAFEYMLTDFNKTASVNNLSFSDYMLVVKYTVSDKNVPTAHTDELNKAFNNSTELSAELRALLG